MSRSHKGPRVFFAWGGKKSRERMYSGKVKKKGGYPTAYIGWPSCKKIGPFQERKSGEIKDRKL